MTGQEFLDRLKEQMMLRKVFEKPYSAADLTQDAAAAGLWYRRLSSMELEQEEALAAARSEVSTVAAVKEDADGPKA